METLALILVLAIIFIMLIFLVLLIIDDIGSTVYYIKAKRCDGTIIEKLENKRVVLYGKHRSKVFGKYIVSFQVENEKYAETTLIKNTELLPGDTVKVRYMEQDGKVYLVNSSAVWRLGELVFGIVFGVPFALLIIYLQEKGIW